MLRREQRRLLVLAGITVLWLLGLQVASVEAGLLYLAPVLALGRASCSPAPTRASD